MYYMERNINDVNREIRASGFFSDLTKKLVSSAGEKAASAIGSKAGEALGNKFFNHQKKKPKITEEKKAADSARSLEMGGNELVKMLQVENKPKSNIHEIYNRLLNSE